jgi:DNA-binding PadR family transcriptional regulator
LEDDIVDVHMEMLEKHRLVEEEVTRIGTSKYYIISEHGKRVLVVYRIISGLAASCYATKYQFNSFILLLSTGNAGNARAHAHKAQTHTERDIDKSGHNVV